MAFAPGHKPVHPPQNIKLINTSEGMERREIFLFEFYHAKIDNTEVGGVKYQSANPDALRTISVLVHLGGIVDS